MYCLQVESRFVIAGIFSATRIKRWACFVLVYSVSSSALALSNAAFASLLTFGNADSNFYARTDYFRNNDSSTWLMICWHDIPGCPLGARVIDAVFVNFYIFVEKLALLQIGGAKLPVLSGIFYAFQESSFLCFRNVQIYFYNFDAVIN